jgi:hypothetical protein
MNAGQRRLRRFKAEWRYVLVVPLLLAVPAYAIADFTLWGSCGASGRRNPVPGRALVLRPELPARGRPSDAPIIVVTVLAVVGRAHNSLRERYQSMDRDYEELRSG